MGGHRPEIWVSDLYSAQKKHPAEDWQVCLAHQLRDCQYGIDAGDTLFSPRMKRIVLRACTWQPFGKQATTLGAVVCFDAISISRTGFTEN